MQRIQYNPSQSFWIFYGLNRLGLPVIPQKVPHTKLGWLRQGSSGLNGWLGELYFDFAGWVKVGGTYEDYQGPNNSTLTLSLQLPKIPIVQVAVYYTKSGFDTIDQAFDPDNALFLAFLKIKAYGPVYAAVTFTRTWDARDDGSYEVQDNFSAGVGLSFTY